MSFSIKILEHSVNPVGCEAISWELNYERFIHAEFMTHRWSRNASSSRAIPYAKMKETVLRSPAMHLHIGANQRGMQSGKLIDRKGDAEAMILGLAKFSVHCCDELMEMGVHKEVINRYIEPWNWIKVIATMGRRQLMNYFALRCTPYAHPNIQRLAVTMARKYRASVPKPLKVSEWHTPYVSKLKTSDSLIWSSARCCWISYNRPDKEATFSDAKKRHDDCISLGHACYDEETEVATDQGWKRWNSVKEGETFLTLNQFTNEISYQKSTRIYSSDYIGSMVQLKMQHVDLLVTPNHNMLAKPREGKYQLIPASDFFKRSHRIRMGTGFWKGRNKTYNSGQMKLLGFFIGDGYLSLNSKKPCFHLTKERKIRFLYNCANEAGYCVTRKENDKYTVDDIDDDYLQLIRNCYDVNRDKTIPTDALEELLEELFEGLMNSDGFTREDGREVYSTSSIPLRDSIQLLAVLMGRGATYGKQGTGYRVSIYQDRELEPCIGWTTSKEVDYEGKIYCATVPNGILYVRRNGIPCWCGNSPLEHQLMARDDRAARGCVPGYDSYRSMIEGECIEEFDFSILDSVYAERDYILPGE